MIWLSRREEVKKIVFTLNPRNLEFIGVYKFITRKKKIIKLYQSELPQYCLLLSTETGDYESIVIRTREKYEQAKLEKVYGLCGVIRNINRDDFIIVTDDTDPETAIKHVVRNSIFKMIFIMFVLGLFFVSLINLVYPFLLALRV